MVFLFPRALLCSALLALPVAIHLLVRRRAKQLDFPTLRHLRETTSFRLRPQRIQQPLLLALRVTALALLITGFARPLVFPRNNPARITHVILLDASFSMSARGRTEAAQEQARNIINGLNEHDRAALIEFSSTATLLAPLTFDRQMLLRALDEYQTSYARADYAAALDEAEALLQSDAAGAAEINLISDFQRSGLNRQQPFRLRHMKAPIITLPVGEQFERNAFTIDKTINATARGVELHATEIVSTDDGRSGARQAWMINVPEATRSNLEWRTESNNRITGAVTAIAPDDFDADDKSFFAFTSPRAERVLVIDDAPTDANVYLRAAFEAAFAINYERLLPDTFEERRVWPAKISEIEPYSHVVITLHGTPRAEELNVIKEYAHGGGIVWLWLARDANAAAWSAATQTDAGQCLPFSQFKRIEAARNLNFVATDAGAAPLRFMSEKSIEALPGVGVRSAYELTPRENAATLLRWNNTSAPAFVTMKFGEGMVLLCATSVERAASDFGQSTALPALASAVLRVPEAMREPLSQTLGEPVHLNLLPDTLIKITDAKGHAVTGRAGELVSRAANFFSEPGIYRAEWTNGTEYLALNAPAAESERALASTEEIKKFFTDEETVAKEDAAKGNVTQIGRIDSGRDSMERRGGAWRYFFLAAFVLLVAELFVARNKLRTHSAAFDDLS